nr:hypothetical protein [Tanacetum cinerariifolium]
MKNDLQLQRDDLPIWLAVKIKFEGLTAFNTSYRPSAIHLRNQDDPHSDAYPKGENRAKRQKTSKHGTYIIGESSSSQADESGPNDYAEIGLLWSLSVFIRSTVIWERVHDFQQNMFSIVSEPIYGIIYENIKKEKRVMRHQEIHKFCDATLKRVLEGLQSYNNDVKHGYMTLSLSKEDVEYLQLIKEEIEERLRHQDQMRRWEMYVNGRPLRSRRERPE